MEKNKSYSRTYFITGLVIGLGIAMLYNYIKEEEISIEIAEIENSIKVEKPVESNKKAKEIKKRTTKKTKKIKIKKKIKKKTTIIVIDSLIMDTLSLDSNLIHLDSNNIDSIINLDNLDSLHIDPILLDSINSVIIYDSLLFSEDDSLEFKVLQIDNTSNNDIKVTQDELIFAMLAYPKGIKDNFDCNSINRLDSMLINNIHKNKKNGLYVEFWQSPLNYKGYKLSKSTLILYGIYEYNAINLKYNEDGFIELSYKEKTYYLKCTDDFKAL